MEEKLGLSHKLELYNREKGTVTGVLDVISLMRIPLCWIRIWDF